MTKEIMRSLHEKLEARFVEIDGIMVPGNYGDPMTEYKAVRNHVGIIDLSYRGKLMVRGPDRIGFLNGILTNDLNQLTPGRGLYSLLLNTKGRIVADLTLLCFPEYIMIDCQPSLAEKTKKFLEAYTISDDVQIEDQTSSNALISVQGPKTIDFLKELIKIDLSGLAENQFMEPEDQRIIACRRTRTGEIGFDLFLENGMQSIWETTLSSLKSFGGHPFGHEALEMLRIEAGIRKYGRDMSEENIALEASLEHAISYSKGCYLGQEVVSRATHVGRVNRFLCGLEISMETVPKSGDRLFNEERQVGLLTSPTRSPTLDKTISLAYVHRDFAKNGTELQLEHDGARFQCRVVELPFLRRADGSTAV